VAGIRTVDAANEYLRRRFQPDYDAKTSTWLLAGPTGMHSSSATAEAVRPMLMPINAARGSG